MFHRIASQFLEYCRIADFSIWSIQESSRSQHMVSSGIQQQLSPRLLAIEIYICTIQTKNFFYLIFFLYLLLLYLLYFNLTIGMQTLSQWSHLIRQNSVGEHPKRCARTVIPGRSPSVQSLHLQTTGPANSKNHGGPHRR